MRAVTSSVIGQRVRFAVRLLRDWRPTVAWGKSLLRSGRHQLRVLAGTFWLLPGVTRPADRPRWCSWSSCWPWSAR